MSKTIEVTWEDQRNINSFNKLNSDLTTANALLQDYQKTAEGHEEAQNELMLVDDDDAARFLFGQCFVHITTESADDKITKESNRLGEEISKLESRKADLLQQLSRLKETLYTKFGNQINLEE